MSIATVKAELVDKLEAITGVNNVMTRVRIFHNLNDVPITDGVIQWWEVTCAELRQSQWANDLVYLLYRFNIDFFYALDDSETTNHSTKTVEDLADTIVADFASDKDFGDTALYGDHQLDNVENVGNIEVEFGLAIRPRIDAAFHQTRFTIWLRDDTPQNISL